MQKERKYCFKHSAQAERLLAELVAARESGVFLGSTLPSGWCHSCFSEEQRYATEKLISAAKGIEYQVLSFFRGNLFDRDVGLRTFAEPYVQWCPSPIYSIEFNQELPPKEPWGLAMEGGVLFNVSMRAFLSRDISGLDNAFVTIKDSFDAYRLSKSARIHEEVPAGEDEPLIVDFGEMLAPDIVKLESGVLLCSLAFAKILKGQWDGFIHNKFQPVRCTGVSPELKKRSKRKLHLSASKESRQTILDDVCSIELDLGATFRDDYVEWLAKSGGMLPSGWLSPIGGSDSELARCARKEHYDADPAMPTHLIPIHTHGDGNYICMETNDDVYVEWNHTDGTHSRLHFESIAELANWLLAQDS